MKIMDSIKKSITIDFDISVKIKWKCPYCGHEQISLISGSAYRIIADQEICENCEKCREDVELNFYENEEENCV